jgi:hypothetical protein
MGGWVDPRTGLDNIVEILGPTGTRTPPSSRPARSPSLYRLRYFGYERDLNEIILMMLIKSSPGARVVAGFQSLRMSVAGFVTAHVISHGPLTEKYE